MREPFYRIVAKFKNGCMKSLPYSTLEQARGCRDWIINSGGEVVCDGAGVLHPYPLGEVEWIEIQREVLPE